MRYLSNGIEAANEKLRTALTSFDTRQKDYGQ
jgi:hypothetical protein